VVSTKATRWCGSRSKVTGTVPKRRVTAAYTASRPRKRCRAAASSRCAIIAARTRSHGNFNKPRGPYTHNEAAAIGKQVNGRAPELGQALRFILSSGARIDEVLHLRADKVAIGEKRVELLGKGGKTRNIRVLDSAVLNELDLSQPFVYLPEQQGRHWKDRLERYVRQTCDELDIRRRGVHGFRATAACEFVDIKRALGDTEMEARRELATLAPHATALRCSAGVWLGHNPQRTEVTYAYVPKHR
jgi:integrase